jgi:hypothetical protein
MVKRKLAADGRGLNRSGRLMDSILLLAYGRSLMCNDDMKITVVAFEGCMTSAVYSSPALKAILKFAAHS